MKLASYIRRHVRFVDKIYTTYNSFRFLFLQSQDTGKFGYRDPTSVVFVPIHIPNPQNIYMYEHTRLQAYAKIISFTGKFIVKKYTGIAPGLTVITGNHVPTVGIPHFSLPILRVNEHEQDVILEEDVWIGANVTILSGVTVGRGAIAGACSVVTKSVPAYGVVVGNPAHVIAAKFTIDQILQHEVALYPPEERFSREFLEKHFEEHFKGMKTIGEG